MDKISKIIQHKLFSVVFYVGVPVMSVVGFRSFYLYYRGEASPPWSMWVLAFVQATVVFLKYVADLEFPQGEEYAALVARWEQSRSQEASVNQKDEQDGQILGP